MGFAHERYEGYERQCTVNVISTWLMAFLLLPALRRTRIKYYGSDGKSGTPHLCMVGSNGHFLTPFSHKDEPSILEALRDFSDMENRHWNTKMLTVLITRELVSRLNFPEDNPEVVINVVDPGYCRTDIRREKPWPQPIEGMMYVADRVLARTAEYGARNYVWAATAGSESHGVYVEDCGLSTPAPMCDSEEGMILQKKAFGELMEILEGSRRG